MFNPFRKRANRETDATGDPSEQPSPVIPDPNWPVDGEMPQVDRPVLNIGPRGFTRQQMDIRNLSHLATHQWNSIGDLSRRLDELKEDYAAQGKILVQLLSRMDKIEESQERKRDKRGRFKKA